MIFLIPFWKNTERALISLLLGAMLGTCWDARGQKLWVKLPGKLSEKKCIEHLLPIPCYFVRSLLDGISCAVFAPEVLTESRAGCPWAPGWAQAGWQRGCARGLGALWPHAGPHLVQGGDFHSCPPNVEMRSCLNWQPNCFLPTSWLAKKNNKLTCIIVKPDPKWIEVRGNFSLSSGWLSPKAFAGF